MVKIIPTPKIVDVNEDVLCKIKCAIFTEKEEWMPFCERFAKDFALMNNGVKPALEKGSISIVQNLAIRPDGYRLVCDTDKLEVIVSTEEGLCYAVSSLLHYLSVNDDDYVARNYKADSFVYNKGIIEDYPDKEYRAMMIDLAREWHPFKTLFKYVDVCFMYKIKYLHLHFVDAQSYTFPSKAFPKLSVEGKYYTHEQLEELKAYAKLRGVILVPEFECPGHAYTLVETYPEIFGNVYDEDLSDKNESEQGDPLPPNFILCAGSEKCFEGTKVLIKEMCDMFPDSPYINIGGDEACIKMWNECSCCRKYMEDNGISDVYELYSEYVGKIASYVLSIGKTPLVYEGFPRRGVSKIPKETIVLAWEYYYNIAPDLIEDGFRIVNATSTPLYTVNSQDYHFRPNEILDWNVYKFDNQWTESKSYGGVEIEPTQQLLGAMICSWQQTYEQEINYIMENSAIISERIWNTTPHCSNEELMDKFTNITSVTKLPRLIQDR